MNARGERYVEGEGWLVYACVLLAMLGALNIIYGIAAIGDSKFFIHDTKYILSGLKTWGWVSLIVGVLQGIAVLSIWRGGQFGRWFGILIASLNAIAVLMSIPAYPLWSISLFAVDILVVYGLARYGSKPSITA
jgi:hypothetical protein